MKLDRRAFIVASGATVAATVVSASPSRLHKETARARVTGLRSDYIDRPLGLENLNPSLSWRIESNERNLRQGAYRICVASSEEALRSGRGDLWDSGKVPSRKSIGINFEGAKLQSRQRCWWCVTVWDQEDLSLGCSDASWWEMGLLSPQDWVAQWLAGDDAVAKMDRETPVQWMWSTGNDEEWLRFRHTFSLPHSTQGGVLFASGRSKYFERIAGAWLDGVPVAEMYPDHDLTRESLCLGSLAPGEHRLEIEVHRKYLLPEKMPGIKAVQAGISVFARLDSGNGRSFRIASGPGWETSHKEDGGATWNPVVASKGEMPSRPDPAMHLRHAFAVEKSVASARLYVSALGCYEARMNGARVGDALLTPEVSQYEIRLLYQIYDVKPLLKPGGSNVIGLTVGDGWYGSHPGRFSWGPGPRRCIAQLEIQFSDGTRQVVTTNPQWRMSRSAILQSEIITGEIYDARLEHTHWDTPGFDAALWQPAKPAEAPPCRLTALVSPAMRATQILKARTIMTLKPGVHVFDFGQNFAGWCRLHVKGAAGTRIDLRFGERLLDSGEIDQFSYLNTKAVDTYTLRGTPDGETFEPHFTYRGFRYVQVTGFPERPTLDALEGIVVHSALEVTGRLRIDHPLLAKLWCNVVWTQRSNFTGVPTDTPVRAERKSYWADNSIFWGTAAFNMDVAAYTRRQMDNARDRQSSTGAFAYMAPVPAQTGVFNSNEGNAVPVWSDGAVILPWTSWRRYADKALLEQNWAAMNRYMRFILDRNPNYLWRNGSNPQFGDHLAIGDRRLIHPETPSTTPLDLIATAYWAHIAQLMAEMAEALGRSPDAARLRALRERVRNAFIETFMGRDGRVGNGSQTSYLLALKFDLVPDDLQPKALGYLVNDIRERGNALTTGIVGTQYLLDVLADAGHTDLVCTLLLRTAYPSWGYMIDQGATTIWERWDGSLQRNFVDASHNHFAFGSVGDFLFRRIAGIDEAEPGFKKIRIRPLMDPRIKRGGGDYDSLMGRISTDWAQTASGGLTLDVALPANTTASIHLPARGHTRIEESRRQIASRRDMTIISRSDTITVVEVGSGTYSFVVEKVP